ncbi:MAG TPA: radical SAM protein [Clostridia bacterium]|jgi:biotin synthase-related radical SAM superfamily protein|nr:radical SAM protein [Clostridia bacterium]
MIRLSTGTAALLKMANCISKVPPTTAYMMAGQKCENNCRFCSQARDSSSKASLLSRVTWPDFPLEETVDAVAAAYKKGNLRRVCIQVVSCRESRGNLSRPVKMIKDRVPEIPLSISAAFTSLEDIRHFLDLGADVVNLSLDGASRPVFENIKQKSWDRAWSFLYNASREFPGHISTHIIAGLGEREKDIAEVLQKCKDLGIGTGLFAFTPIKGTPLESTPQPPLVSYRRLQAARYLIVNGYARAEQFSFNTTGFLTGFGMGSRELAEILGNGKAFETSGCRGCNRPYYNESPRQIPYNYPRPLIREEIEKAVAAVIEGTRFSG